MRYPQIAQREERLQLRRILRQIPAAHLRETELALEHPKWMFDLRPDACLRALDLIEQSAVLPGLVQCPALARHHRHMPADVRMVLLTSSCLCAP